MENQFVPYELALQLKQLGYSQIRIENQNKNIFGYYYQQKFIPNRGLRLHENFNLELSISAPLWQQAFDWFREKYDLHIEILPRYQPKKLNTEKVLYSWAISGKNFEEYNGHSDVLNHWIGIHNGTPYIADVFYHVVNSYQEARQICLEELIKITENEKI